MTADVSIHLGTQDAGVYTINSVEDLNRDESYQLLMYDSSLDFQLLIAAPDKIKRILSTRRDLSKVYAIPTGIPIAARAAYAEAANRRMRNGS